MTLPVVYLPEARDDIDVTFARYESRRVGLGEAFAAALAKRTEEIQTNPAIYGLVAKDVRAIALRRFPYVVYYRVEPTQILILAVQHGRRSASIWQART